MVNKHPKEIADASAVLYKKVEEFLTGRSVRSQSSIVSLISNMPQSHLSGQLDAIYG
jgi:hypothetical protein